jgi:hypothetical protein
MSLNSILVNENKNVTKRFTPERPERIISITDKTRSLRRGSATGASNQYVIVDTEVERALDDEYKSQPLARRKH